MNNAMLYFVLSNELLLYEAFLETSEFRVNNTFKSLGKRNCCGTVQFKHNEGYIITNPV